MSEAEDGGTRSGDMSSGVRPRSRIASQDLGAALLDAAEAVLVREGLAGVSVRTVAREAGVAPMGVYNRFGSKSGLVTALALRAAMHFRDAVAVDSRSDPESAFRHACRAYRDFALGQPHSYRLLFLDAGQLVGGSAEVVKVARQALEHLAGLVGTIRNPHGGATRATDAATQAVWAALHGAVALELNQLTQADPAASFHSLIEVLLNGLTAATTSSQSTARA